MIGIDYVDAAPTQEAIDRANRILADHLLSKGLKEVSRTECLRGGRWVVDVDVCAGR